MEQELTMEEIVRLMNEIQGDFMIHVEFGGEAEMDAEEK